MVNVNTGAGEAATSYSEAPRSTNVAAMSMVTALFFFWGFVTVLNDVLVPHLKAIFDLNYAKVSRSSSRSSPLISFFPFLRQKLSTPSATKKPWSPGS